MLYYHQLSSPIVFLGALYNETRTPCAEGLYIRHTAQFLEQDLLNTGHYIILPIDAAS